MPVFGAVDAIRSHLFCLLSHEIGGLFALFVAFLSFGSVFIYFYDLFAGFNT